MILSEILAGVAYSCNKDLPDIQIKDICYDSRKCAEGILFVALVGAFTDGHAYISSAYEKGSRVFLCEKEVSLPDDAIVITVENTRSVLAHISCNFFSHPSKELSVIGITGTKGKTTVAHIIKFVLEQGNIKTGIIGTVGSFYDDVTIETVNTTPESYELQKTLRQMVDGGCKAVAMEVSSLGLKHHRVEGTHFSWGIFTNLYPDHIGTNEHDSFEEYAFWKTQLFPLCDNAIVNIDDPFSSDIIKICKGKVITYGSSNADYVITDIEKTKMGNILAVDFSAKHKESKRNFTIAMPGDINAHNALIAIALGDELKIESDVINEGLKSVYVKGRGEILRVSDSITVIIDYAHNGISLKSIIDTAKEYEHNRIITLFGSVGGRTECRREELGTVSGKLSDLTIITSDDPDFEDPQKICEEIASYCEEMGGEYVIIPDRAKAIHYAIEIAKDGDIIILAGKGHEEFMKINGKKVPFSEKQEVIKAFSKKKEG